MESGEPRASMEVHVLTRPEYSSETQSEEQHIVRNKLLHIVQEISKTKDISTNMNTAIHKTLEILVIMLTTDVNKILVTLITEFMERWIIRSKSNYEDNSVTQLILPCPVKLGNVVALKQQFTTERHKDIQSLRMKVDAMKKQLKKANETLKKTKLQLTESISRESKKGGDNNKKNMEDLKSEIEAWRVVFTFVLA